MPDTIAPTEISQEDLWKQLEQEDAAQSAVPAKPVTAPQLVAPVKAEVAQPVVKAEPTSLVGNEEEDGDEGDEEVDDEDEAEEDVAEAATDSTESQEEKARKKRVNWKKRYRDLHSEYGRRGQETHQLRTEIQELRTAMLERKQKETEVELARVKHTPAETKQEDPFALSAEEKQYMEDYPDMMRAAEKSVMSKFTREVLPTFEEKFKKQEQVLAALARQEQERRETQVLVEHDKKMSSLVGEHWLDVYQHPQFVEYVNTNPDEEVRVIMTQPEQFHNTRGKAQIIQEFLLANPKVAAKFLKTPVASAIPTAPTDPVKQARRQALGGLMTSSTTTPTETRPQTKEEMWAAIQAEEP